MILRHFILAALVGLIAALLPLPVLAQGIPALTFSDQEGGGSWSL